MLNIKDINAAFVHSSTPHLLLTAQAPYFITACNAASLNWYHGKAEELLPQSILADYLNFEELTGISQTQLIRLFEHVISSKTTVKVQEGSDPLPGDILPVNPKGCAIEIYPIVDDQQVVYLVLRIEPLNDSLKREPNGSDQTPLTLPESHQSFSLILDSLSNVIFVLEVETAGVYKFSFVNQAFQVTTGLPVDRVIGSYVHQVIPEPSLSLVLEKYQEAIDSKKQVSWQEVSDYPAGQKTGEVLVEPVFDAQGNCLRLVGIVIDITQHKEAEAKQLRLTQDLYQHNRDLQQFTYIVSHNLRAPLANALGLVRHLPEVPPGTDIFQQYVSNLLVSVEKLDTILKDVNQILSIRDRQNLMPTEPIVLADVCRQVAKDLEAELTACGGTLHITVDQDFTLQASRAYLYSIFQNLMTNAIKYRSVNRPLQIDVSSCRTEGEKVLQFSDNGSGINLAKYENNLFKLYKRFHPNIEGRGIGLFLVKTHVEAIGGHINVQSRLDEGTTFSLHFKTLA